MFHDNNTLTSGVGPIVDVLLVARSTSCASVTADGSQALSAVSRLMVFLSFLSAPSPFHTRFLSFLPSKVRGPVPVTKTYLYNLRPGTVLVAQEELCMVATIHHLGSCARTADA